MAMRLPQNIVPLFLFLLMLAISIACSTASNMTNNTQASTNKTNHRCQVWKNKCERHISLYCQDENKQQEIFSSCCEAMQQGASNSGTYTIKTTSFSTTQAQCDMEKDGGGWMVIMRRSSSEANFGNRLMHEYEDGFGSLDGDFWYGLKTVSQLTTSKKYELRVDLFNSTNDTRSAAHGVYSSFSITPVNYTLNLGEFSTPSNILDSLEPFKGQPFLAKKTDDEDTEKDSLLDLCIRLLDLGAGGWWFTDNCVGKGGLPGSILTRGYRHLYWHVTTDSMNASRKPFAKYELKMRLKECSQK